MHQLAIVVYCVVLNLACVPKPTPPAPPQPPGPWSQDAGSLTCADACQHLQDLVCHAGRPTPDGHSCLEVCRSIQDSGVVAWNLSCIFLASTCGEAERCQ